jgi:hypothetical protein
MAIRVFSPLHFPQTTPISLHPGLRYEPIKA